MLMTRLKTPTTNAENYIKQVMRKLGVQEGKRQQHHSTAVGKTVVGGGG
jgi:hypothetical protein